VEQTRAIGGTHSQAWSPSKRGDPFLRTSAQSKGRGWPSPGPELATCAGRSRRTARGKFTPPTPKAQQPLQLRIGQLPAGIAALAIAEMAAARKHDRRRHLSFKFKARSQGWAVDRG